MASTTTTSTPPASASPASERRASGQRPDLSPEVILDAAQALIEREGDSALTFRRLGAELGADPTAAYRHFRNKDELLLALGDRLLGEAIRLTTDQMPPEADWRTAMRLAAHNVRDTLVHHPKLAAVVSVRVTQGKHEAVGIEQGLAIMSGTGLPVRDVVGIQRAFADTVLAWSLFSATFVGLPEDAKTRDAAAWATTYQSLPPDQFPQIHAGRDHLDDFDDAFDLALDLLFDGIQARIDAMSPTATTQEMTP